MRSLDLNQKHILIETDKGIFLIDTGCPISFAFDKNLHSVACDGKIFSINQDGSQNFRQMTRNEDINNLTGFKIAGIIGNDILRGGFTFDGINNEFYFSPIIKEGEREEIKIRFDDYYIDTNLKIDSHDNLRVILDTGASFISYVHTRYLDGSRETNTPYKDFSPVFGHLSGTLKEITVTFPNGNTITTLVGEDKHSFVPAVIGFNHLCRNNYYVVFPYEEGKAFLY